MKNFLHHFREKEKVSGTEEIYESQCPFCSVQCTMKLVEERIVTRKRVSVNGTPNVTSEGRLCVKGMHAHQHHFNPKRIQTPMQRKGDAFVSITWDEAFALMKDRFESIQETDGKDAIGVYGGGSLTNEEAYLLGKFARVTLGTRFIDYNGRFCMSAAASGANDAFGMDRGFTNKLSEIPYSKCIILAGTNIAECQPTLMPYLEEAKQNGSFLIAIDPRETATTDLSDLHIKIKPGMDASFVNALLKVIINEKLVDSEFIINRTKGYEELCHHLDDSDLEQLSDVVDVPVETITEVARTFATSPTGMLLTARGVEQLAYGYDTVRNYLNLLLVTGKIGRIGCGYGAVTGQGNGQGGREHGQKADQLPGYRSIENLEDRRYVANVWGIDEGELPGKGVSAYEMMEKMDRGDLKSLFVMGSNPVVSNPNINFVEKALKSLEFLVVVDMFESETGQLADLILPSSSYLEDEGTMTNFEGRVALRKAARVRPEGVRHDWEILCQLSSVLGKGAYFQYSNPQDIFNELRLASKGGIADYSGITYDRLQAERVYWPCTEDDPDGEKRLFSESFPTKDGRASIGIVRNHVPSESVSAQYPLYLTTGRVLEHYLTGVQTRNSPGLRSRVVEPFVQIHPETAKRFGLQPHEMACLTSERGEIQLRCHVTDRIREDTLFVPFHWGGKQCINRLTSQELDPRCKMPSFKVCSVDIQPSYEKSESHVT
ncbi:assimilatory nitrate reductase catalytic subunit NasC [Guptibacillus hwajinpoensis]|uniref:assimilatory nitrate reductase catalytic subunit NasC n=1 Tax=Guptibacillus hwajinpoensis TaxID=208199 RepID=UPI003735E81F